MAVSLQLLQSLLPLLVVAWYPLALAAPRRALAETDGQPAATLFDGTWETVGKQATIPDPYKPGIKQPSVRYSSSTVPWGDKMIMTHGYFYNRNVKPSSPAWLKDTWSFSYTSNEWTMLNDGKGVAPSPRYGHVVCVHGDNMYYFGGDDGDHVKSPTNYRSHHFNDLWKFDLNAKTWSQVTPTGGTPWPAPRSLHSGGLIGEEFIIFGGLGRNDTWGFNLRTQVWREFHPTNSPGIRYAQSYATAAGKLFVFGGARRGGKPFDDFWAFDPAVKNGEWLDLAPAPKQRAAQVVLKSWPPGRSYGSLNTFQNPVDGNPTLALFGGANCTRGCKCKGDTWLWDIRAKTFTLVAVAEGTEPVPRYRQSLSEHKGHLYVFGGESYKPYMYHNSVSKLTVAAHKSAGGSLRGLSTIFDSSNTPTPATIDASPLARASSSTALTIGGLLHCSAAAAAIVSAFW